MGHPGECVTENESNPNRARDHLANERTFLAWVRTGRGDCGVWIRDWAVCDCDAAIDGAAGASGADGGDFGVDGVGSRFVAGVVLVVAGLVRYRKTRAQLDAGTFEPAGFVLDLITILTVVFGLALAGYLIYAEKSLG